MELVIKKLEDSAVWRLVAFAVLSAILGWGGSAGVAWFHGEPSAIQEMKVTALEKRVDQHDTAEQGLREAISEMRGGINDLTRALEAENDLRRREEDKMDERLKYLERRRP